MKKILLSSLSLALLFNPLSLSHASKSQPTQKEQELNKYATNFILALASGLSAQYFCKKGAVLRGEVPTVRSFSGALCLNKLIAGLAEVSCPAAFKNEAEKKSYMDSKCHENAELVLNGRDPETVFYEELSKLKGDIGQKICKNAPKIHPSLSCNPSTLTPTTTPVPSTPSATPAQSTPSPVTAPKQEWKTAKPSNTQQGNLKTTDRSQKTPSLVMTPKQTVQNEPLLKESVPSPSIKLQMPSQSKEGTNAKQEFYKEAEKLSESLKNLNEGLKKNTPKDPKNPAPNQ